MGIGRCTETRRVGRRPVPLPGYPLHIEDRYPYKGLERIFDEEEGDGTASADLEDNKDGEERFHAVNQWLSRRRECLVVVLQSTTSGRSRAMSLRMKPGEMRLDLLLRTGCASDVWGLRQETQAMTRLAELVSDRQFRLYVLTGTFVETSRRSGVSYVFRRLRPTIAVREFTDPVTGRTGKQMLSALCLHPIAYYEQTFAGSMVPTDDVIAHLMLMRGDEPMFWRRANQHSLSSVESGL